MESQNLGKKMCAERWCTAALESITDERDVGVWTTSNIKPSHQRLKAANKATSVLQSIRKCFQVWERKLFMIIKKAYIRPHLEYWPGHHILSKTLSI